MTTIPRAELNAIAHRHGADYDLGFDPGVEWVRQMSAWLCRDLATGDRYAPQLLAEAGDLDALADRYEREATR